MLTFENISDKEVQRNPETREWGLRITEYCTSHLFHDYFFSLSCGLMGQGNICLSGFFFWSYEVQVEIVSHFIGCPFINHARGNQEHCCICYISGA